MISESDKRLKVTKSPCMLIVWTYLMQITNLEYVVTHL